MGSPNIVLGPVLWITLATAVLVGAVIAVWVRLGTARATPLAAGRAVLQLGAVSALLGAIVGPAGASAGFVALMVGVAALTSARRITRNRSGWWAALPVAPAPLPMTAGLGAAGVVPADGIAIIPMAGIMIGGAMTATSPAGRRALDELTTRRGEVEAALSPEFPDRDAAIEIAWPTAAQAMAPALDQTRTVGLVALPGAFVGMLLGGATPLQPGVVQVLVLVLLLAVETVAVAARASPERHGTRERGAALRTIPSSHGQGSTTRSRRRGTRRPSSPASTPPGPITTRLTSSNGDTGIATGPPWASWTTCTGPVMSTRDGAIVDEPRLERGSHRPHHDHRTIGRRGGTVLNAAA
ncbi:ABC transporter permease [Pseudonocardia bannensis]|uniref:ABC transporter permease n=1 Tax=Pseudonocardia bannensis TaxID=630973 RepID=UPI0028A80681|nr:ABC transporter permease [Pseudonocardia bannensis]